MRVQEGVQGTHTKIGDLQTLQQQSETAQSQRSVTQENTVQVIHDKLREIQTIQQQNDVAQGQRSVSHGNAVQVVQDKIRDLQIAQQQITMVQAQRSAEHEAAVKEPIAQLLVAQQRLELKLDVIKAGHIADNAESQVRAGMESVFNTGNSVDRTLTSRTIQITTSVTRWQCADSCMCSCHRHPRPKKRTPNTLDRFIGVLFVGYFGLPKISERCNDEDCIQQSSATVLVAYFFPTWLLARAMILMLRLSWVHGPELNLRIPRVVSNTSRIFYCASSGDIDGMKEILHRHLGSPMDIDVTNGYTALTVNIAPPIA